MLPRLFEPLKGEKAITTITAKLTSNASYIEAVKKYECGLKKPSHDLSVGKKSEFFLQAYRRITGEVLSKEEVIVDFGCGSGASTGWLAEAGFTVHGVDILEYWGKDLPLLGEIGPTLSERVRSHLHVIDPLKNDLPFKDSSIRLIFSDQTLEHVFDYRSVFAEQARVLKPGGIAIHRFPHGWCLVEPHTKVPMTALTGLSVYLTIWAMLGRRNQRQIGFNWQDTLTSNRKLLATTNYVSRNSILRAASNLRLDPSFEDFLDISDRRAGHLYRLAASRGIGGLAKMFLSRFQDNRILVLKKQI